MSSTVLVVNDLKVWLNAGDAVIRAVDGVSMVLHRGETIALVGESGCGKSMFALSLMRLLPDSAVVVGGSVNLNDENLLELPESRMRNIRGKRMSIIFQEPTTSLNPVLTIGNQIAEALGQHTNIPRDGLRNRVLELLEAVRMPDPKKRIDEYPFQLSGGMKQRVMIAMAISCEPDVLIADEPTTALDVTTQSQILSLLKELQTRLHMAIVLITHDLGVVSQMADTVGVMYAGEIVEMAMRKEFFMQLRHPYARKLFESLPNRKKRGQSLSVIKGNVPALSGIFLGCRFEKRCDHTFDLCTAIRPSLSNISPEHKVRCHLYVDPKAVGVEENKQKILYAPSKNNNVAPKNNNVILSGENIRIYFPIQRGLLKRVVGYIKAVDGVSINIHRGKTLALVGESGCGKTTVGKGILKIIPQVQGKIVFDRLDISILPERSLRQKRAGFQFIFQDPYASLNPKMRVFDIIEEGMIALNIGTSKPQREKMINELLDRVGLAPETKQRYPHEFSGGQRQRIAIARALAVQPQLVVCDEPTSALDVSVQAQILNLLKELQSTMNLAYLFITHNISVVEYFADEVAVMYLGKIVEYGKVSEVLESPRHPYTRALLSAVPQIDASGQREIIVLQGDIPSPANPPTGCYFHPRCSAALKVCSKKYPEVTSFTLSHTSSCHLYS